MMEIGTATRASAAFHPSSERAIEQDGLLGTRRSWALINRFEVIFLIVGILAAVVTDTLTIIRLIDINNSRDPDLAYGILILVNSLFLLLFLITGIFYQRITDIIAFFVSAVLLTIYVIVHYVTRERHHTTESSKDEKIRLARLVLTIIFNGIFIPLAYYVIRDYRRDEFSKRIFGLVPTARVPLRIYNTYDCLARINTMLSISTAVLNLYNFNDYEAWDKILLGVAISFALLWLGTGVGMVRLESYPLVGLFYVVSLFQPGFISYCLYSAVKDKPTSTTTTITTLMTSTEMTSQTTSEFSLPTTSSGIITTTPAVLIPVLNVLYVCLLFNILTHIASMVFGFLCVRNFGKQLKERVFNNPFDKWFQQFGKNTKPVETEAA